MRSGAAPSPGSQTAPAVEWFSHSRPYNCRQFHPVQPAETVSAAQATRFQKILPVAGYFPFLENGRRPGDAATLTKHRGQNCGRENCSIQGWIQWALGLPFCVQAPRTQTAFVHVLTHSPAAHSSRACSRHADHVACSDPGLRHAAIVITTQPITTPLFARAGSSNIPAVLLSPQSAQNAVADPGAKFSSTGSFSSVGVRIALKAADTGAETVLRLKPPPSLSGDLLSRIRTCLMRCGPQDPRA